MGTMYQAKPTPVKTLLVAMTVRIVRQGITVGSLAGKCHRNPMGVIGGTIGTQVTLGKRKGT